MEENSYFREAGQQEREGKLDAALKTLRQAANDPTRMKILPAIKASAERVLQKAANQAKVMPRNVDVIHENSNNPGTYIWSGEDSEFAPPVSLTTISARIDRLPRTVESILNQSIRPHSINIYVSEEPYLLDKGISRSNENVYKLIDLGANIYMVKNIGPYRKQYPIIHQLKSRDTSPEAPFVTMDDDVLYPEDALKNLLESSQCNDGVVAHRGREIVFHQGRISAYRDFREPQTRNSCVNLATGKNGVVYRLKHFPSDPSEYVGHILAPTADDIWCKWVTAVRCVSTQIIEPKAAFEASRDYPESLANDKNSLFHRFNAKGTNDDAIGNMEAFFMFRLGVNVMSIYGGEAI